MVHKSIVDAVNSKRQNIKQSTNMQLYQGSLQCTVLSKAKDMSDDVQTHASITGLRVERHGNTTGEVLGTRWIAVKVVL